MAAGDPSQLGYLTKEDMGDGVGHVYYNFNVNKINVIATPRL